MKLLATALLLMAGNVFASSVSVKLDLSAHIDYLKSVTAEAVYESRSTEVGCQTYSGDIFNPTRPIYIERSIQLNSRGVALESLPTELSRCKAKLAQITLKLRLDRGEVARIQNASKLDVDRNRIDFHFGVFEYRPGQVVRDPKLTLTQSYVAGSDSLKYTLVSGFEAAPIIDGAIDLTL